MTTGVDQKPDRATVAWIGRVVLLAVAIGNLLQLGSLLQSTHARNK